MKVSIIGAGSIGGDLARRLALAGHEVRIGTLKGPEAVPAHVVEAGARAVPMDATVEDPDVLVVAVPFGVQPELAGLIARLPERTVVVDTSNYYPSMNGHIEAVVEGQVESVWAQEQLGRPVIKAWNAGLAETQHTKGRPAGSPGRIALPVTGDSDDARATVMRLVDDSGFDPVDAGPLAESWRQQPGTPAYCTELDVASLRAALAAARKEKAAPTRDALMEHFGSLGHAPSHDEVVAANRAATA